ncbi:MAG: hypothetical protein ACW7DW_19435, partial [Paraglaciecola chathamensis]
MITPEIPVKTFEQRESEINTIEDIDRQLKLAKATVTRLRNKGKAADTLAEKLAIDILDGVNFTFTLFKGF